MSDTTIPNDTTPHDVDHDATPTGVGDVGRGRSTGALVAGVLAAAFLLAGLIVGLVLVAGGGDGDEAATGPEQPTFTFVIPAGSGEQIENGIPLDILPRELHTEVGETIEIVNEDDEAHVLGPWFLAAGETLRQRFVTAGVFEGSCTVHPSGAFTVIVEPTDEA